MRTTINWDEIHKINPCKIIKEARELKPVLNCSLAEFDYVLESSCLSDAAKLTWLLIARHTIKEPDLSWTFSLKTLEDRLGKRSFHVIEALNELAHFDFLTINFNEKAYYDCTLKLPSPGLLVLKKTAKRLEFIKEAFPCPLAETKVHLEPFYPMHPPKPKGMMGFLKSIFF